MAMFTIVTCVTLVLVARHAYKKLRAARAYADLRAEYGQDWQ